MRDHVPYPPLRPERRRSSRPDKTNAKRLKRSGRLPFRHVKPPANRSPGLSTCAPRFRATHSPTGKRPSQGPGGLSEGRKHSRDRMLGPAFRCKPRDGYARIRETLPKQGTGSPATSRAAPMKTTSIAHKPFPHGTPSPAPTCVEYPHLPMLSINGRIPRAAKTIAPDDTPLRPGHRFIAKTCDDCGPPRLLTPTRHKDIGSQTASLMRLRSCRCRSPRHRNRCTRTNGNTDTTPSTHPQPARVADLRNRGRPMREWRGGPTNRTPLECRFRAGSRRDAAWPCRWTRSTSTGAPRPCACLVRHDHRRCPHLRTQK